MVIKASGIVDVFSQPYERWSCREATDVEFSSCMSSGLHFAEAMYVQDTLEANVTNPFQAASSMLRTGVDNGLENHINWALAQSAEYAALRRRMPQPDPDALVAYQNKFTKEDMAAADIAIKQCGVTLADGQMLFHGGFWGHPVDTVITTSRPFSTSFCPQVALRNAEWNAKAYNAGEINLMVVRVCQPQSKAYILSLDGEKGNEKEVVFASGAKIRLVRKTFICNSKVYGNWSSSGGSPSKEVPAFVLDVNIS
ncbi:hypothetical protein [Acetobacter malorum]|nr:hypothetical protein [Acetobacter malorum]KXV09429.1 hypothetical protein AD930_02735 [Acetobacter malorum]